MLLPQGRMVCPRPCKQKSCRCGNSSSLPEALARASAGNTRPRVPIQGPRSGRNWRANRRPQHRTRICRQRPCRYQAVKEQEEGGEEEVDQEGEATLVPLSSVSRITSGRSPYSKSTRHKDAIMHASCTNGNARGLDSQAEWTGYSRDLRIDETPCASWEHVKQAVSNRMRPRIPRTAKRAGEEDEEKISKALQCCVDQ